MRLQVLDESAAFSCGSCGHCCNQPWRTLIEPEKAHALDRHDFSKYPHLAGKAFYRASGDAGGLYELAKGEGVRCLFLDSDNLCIIHKELGPEAKPHMCRQFPFLPARTWTEDRISVNYGCPAVQNRSGLKLADQRADIAAVVPPGQRPPDPDALTPLDATVRLTSEEADALFHRAMILFDEAREGDIWSRFAEALAMLALVRARKAGHPGVGKTDSELVDLLRTAGPLTETAGVPEVTAFDSPADAPMPVRFLFAATLFPDTLPADATGSMGFFKRLTLVPRLMALARLSGVYASRLLGCNVVLHEVLAHPVREELEPAATALLLRYYRSRLWQRFPAGTRLPVVAGIHQHIHDLNAILFLARAEALRQGTDNLTEPLIRQALARVEFHLANQARLYDHTLKGWLLSQLGDVSIAAGSLRLMSLRRQTARPEAVDREIAAPASNR